MATIVKESHGILYEEDFREENPLIWSLTPSSCDCLRFENDGLHILHNSNYISYTLKEPEEEYCLITRIDHKLYDEDDIGGLIVFSDVNNYAECQTYLATTPSSLSNNGGSVSAGYDLSNQYVRYTFYTSEDESGQPDSSSSSSEETIINPATGFVDTIYNYIRMIKYNNVVGHTYQFFASSDGIKWIEVGNVDYDNNNSIGFFLYSVEEPINRRFVVNEFYLYKNPYITINGINILQEFELFEYINEHNIKTIIRSDTTPGINMINHHGNKIQINTNHLILPLRNVYLRVYPKGHYELTTVQYQLDGLTFGGDIFSINYDIKLYLDNLDILAGEAYDLGNLFVNSFRRNIVIYNNEDFDLGNIKVSIIAFSEYYSGEEVVKLAFYDNDIEVHPDDVEYTDSLLIPKLDAHTGIELVMKLSDIPKQEFYSVANKYRFKLVIE